MTNPSSEEEVLAQWLRQRLTCERELLEKRHCALLDEFELYLKQQRQPCNALSLEDVNPDFSSTVPMERDTMDAGSLKCPMTEEDHPANEPDIPSDDDCSIDMPQYRESFIEVRISKHLPDTSMAKLVTSRSFEVFFAIVIFLNLLEMALQLQYDGFSIGFAVGYPRYLERKEDVWPNMNTYFAISGWLFGITYTIEVILKMIGLQRGFFDHSNLFDSLIVILFWVEKSLSSVKFPVDTMILRLFRLFRVLRLLRLIHTIAGFAHLLLMITALKGSLSMLGWASMLLFGLQTVFAFILTQMLRYLVIENETYAMETRLECFKYFGTFARAMFSMFELSLANWIPISRFLIEDINEFFIIFAVFYKLTLGFAVVGVVNACFIKETFKIVANDRTMMVIENMHEKAAFVKEITKFMEHAERNSTGRRDGTLTVKEFERVCHDEHVKNWLGAQGLDASDARKLFELMDDGSGYLETQELVRGVAKLRGPAKSLDLVALHRMHAEDDMIRRLEHRLHCIEANMFQTSPRVVSIPPNADKKPANMPGCSRVAI